MSDRVAIGYIHPGQIGSAFQLSLDESFAFDAAGPQRLVWPPIRNQCGVDLATGRNEVVTAFLDRTDADWLLFVDADMAWEPDAIERLVHSADATQRPVVGGLCFGYKRAALSPQRSWRFNLFPTIYEFVERDDEVGFHAAGSWPRGEMVQVAGTGAAFILIHRRILDAIAAKYGAGRWFDHITHPKGPTTFSEDLSFCVRVAAVDAPIFVNTDVETSHDKHVSLDLWAFDNWPKISPPLPKAVITGTGRCGTAYVTAVLNELGITTSHERVFTPEGYQYASGYDVAVSWLATPELPNVDDDAVVVHLVRDPLDVVRSLVGMGLLDPNDKDAGAHARYRRFIQRHVPDLPEDPVLAAMHFVVKWCEAIEPYASDVVKVEDLAWGRMLKRLGHRRSKVQIARAIDAVGRNINTRPRADLTWQTLPACPERDALAELATKYGYEVDL